MHELVKHLALIMAQTGVVVLASYHSSRAGFVHVVHRSPAATSPGLMSPGLCGAGCAVQGGGRGGGCEEGALGWSMRRQRRSAPCAWSAAVVLPRNHAQPQAEMMRPNSGVPPHSPAQGAACSAGLRGAPWSRGMRLGVLRMMDTTHLTNAQRGGSPASMSPGLALSRPLGGSRVRWPAVMAKSHRTLHHGDA